MTTQARPVPRRPAGTAARESRPTPPGGDARDASAARRDGASRRRGAFLGNSGQPGRRLLRPEGADAKLDPDDRPRPSATDPTRSRGVEFGWRPARAPGETPGRRPSEDGETARPDGTRAKGDRDGVVARRVGRSGDRLLFSTTEFLRRQASRIVELCLIRRFPRLWNSATGPLLYAGGDARRNESACSVATSRADAPAARNGDRRHHESDFKKPGRRRTFGDSWNCRYVGGRGVANRIDPCRRKHARRVRSSASRALVDAE